MKKSAVLIFLIILITFSIMFFGHPYKVIDAQKSDNYYFTFFKNEIHYVPMGNWFALADNNIENVDIKTFTVLGRNYAKDKNHAYYQGMRVESADVATLEVVCDMMGRDYAKDKNMLYFGRSSFKDLDISSFKFTQGVCGLDVEDSTHKYSVDPNNYGEYGSCTRAARTQGKSCVIPYMQDPGTFQSMGDDYSKDSETAYYLGSPISGSDGKTFTVVGESYAKDDSSVFYQGKVLAGSDADSFTLLRDGFAKDARHVYLDGLLFDGPDAKTFTVIGAEYSKDTNNVYFGIKREDDAKGNPTSFSPEMIVVGADAKTFTLVNKGKNYEAKDATRRYKSGIVQP